MGTNWDIKRGIVYISIPCISQMRQMRAGAGTILVSAPVPSWPSKDAD
jgi:hypothetical protein